MSDVNRPRHTAGSDVGRAPLFLLLTSFLVPMLICAASVPASAQDVDSTRPWYDTLEVERPRIAQATRLERVALAAFAALSLPVGLFVGTTTLIPPAIVFRDDGAGIRGFGISAGAGVGFGADTSLLIHFPSSRLQVDVGWFFEREHELVVHASMLIDQWLASLHAQDFVWLTASEGIGFATDFSGGGPYVEAFVGIANPMGIQFMPLYPMHHVGLRGRFGYDWSTDRRWYELLLGITSTFGVKL